MQDNQIIDNIGEENSKLFVTREERELLHQTTNWSMAFVVIYLTKYILLFFSITICLTSCLLPRGIYGAYSNTSVAYAQDFKKYLEPNAKLIQSWYNYTIELTQDDKYILKVYYPEKGAMISREEFSDHNLSILEGKSSYYTDEGELVFEGLFNDGKRVGDWTGYKPTDILFPDYVLQEEEGNKPAQFFKNGRLYDSGKLINRKAVYTKVLSAETKSMVEKNPIYKSCSPDMSEEKRKICSQDEMIAFINRNIHYPQKARKLEIDGTAIMRFTVREDGSVSEIKALRGICAPLEEECVRVIRMMPKWTPGEQNGQATSFHVILPISFDLITGY